GHPWPRLGGIGAGHDLVEQQEVRGGGQRTGQLESLLVHQRQLGGTTERLALEPDEGQQALGVGGDVTGIAGAAVQQTDTNVVERGESREGPNELKRPRDARSEERRGGKGCRGWWSRCP